MLLTCAEVPGVYVQPDRGFVMALDNIQTLILKDTKEATEILLLNRTPCDAVVSVVSEDSATALWKRHAPNWRSASARIVRVPSGGMMTVSFAKTASD